MRHSFATHALFAVSVWSTTLTFHFVPTGFIPVAAVIGAIHLQQKVVLPERERISNVRLVP
jgi:hypothetical protein